MFILRVYTIFLEKFKFDNMFVANSIGSVKFLVIVTITTTKLYSLTTRLLTSPEVHCISGSDLQHFSMRYCYNGYNLDRVLSNVSQTLNVLVFGILSAYSRAI